MTHTLLIILKCRSVVQDVVTDQPHSRLQSATKDVGRITVEDFAQGSQRLAGKWVSGPDDVAGSDGIAHMQVATGHDGKNRADLLSPGHLAHVHARWYGHYIRTHERGNEFRVPVAQ